MTRDCLPLTPQPRLAVVVASWITLDATVPRPGQRPNALSARRVFIWHVTEGALPWFLVKLEEVYPSAQQVKEGSLQAQSVLDPSHIPPFPHDDHLSGLNPSSIGRHWNRCHVISTNCAHALLHWKLMAGPIITELCRDKLPETTCHPVHWKDLDGNQG